jgi:RNA polymerase sigma-32 factor
MRDVQRYPLLSKEEEHDLAVRFFENDDLEAAKKLVTANLRLVVKIAYDYRQAYKNILDLVQEGNIGLMQAVKKYDPYKGVKLSSYAAWWIRAYILRYILNNHRLVKVGTTQAQRKLFFNLQKEKARLSAMGIEPTAELIAERLNVPERDVVSMDMRLAAGDASLDAPVGTAEGRSVARVELLPSDDVRVDDTLADAEVGDQFSEKIHEFGKSLEGKEKKIFEDRLVAEDPKTLQALGDGFGVSRERVRQIEKRLLKKLKGFLHEELGETIIEVYESD